MPESPKNYDLLDAFFDADYYLKNNPDVAAGNVDPLTHYMEFGARERRNPAANFDSVYYLSQCAAVGESPENPLLHFLTVGAGRGLRCRPSTDDGNGAVPAEHRAPASQHRGTAVVTVPAAARGPGEAPPAQTDGRGSLLGHVDVFGYSIAAGGWLFCGWIPRPTSTDPREPVELIAHYDRSERSCRALLTYFECADLRGSGIGVVVYAPGSRRPLGRLRHITVATAGGSYRMPVSSQTRHVHDQELIDVVYPNLVQAAMATPALEELLRITSQRGFTGHDTLPELTQPVRMEIDHAFLCPPDGVLLRGWLLAPPGAIRTIRLRSGDLSSEVTMAHALRVDRPDVIAAVGPQTGFSDPHCGFVAYVPASVSEGDVSYLEIELEDGEIGFKPINFSRRTGLDAIRSILEEIDLRGVDLNGAFDRVVGPAIGTINAARLRNRPTTTAREFGRVPDRPRYSLVIPLYGRIDFVEYQMALFSRWKGIRVVEVIYVLDDPRLRLELETLAWAVWGRFGIPFRILATPTNLGFAPASNLGLQAARGHYVCFLNSDVFPITDDWLERLARVLETDRSIGIVGARLLFEDGSVQHEGCAYQSIPELANWMFIEHPNKAHRPAAPRGTRVCEAITGACMLMRRSLALELRGFDEGFVIGDFEDSDLCRRAHKRGLASAVDDRVLAYHLERKSQATPSVPWRMNLTLYNAWVHQRRWFSAPARAGVST